MNEKEAIEQLKIIKRNIDKKYINTKNSKAIKTVLNLIEKKDKIIDYMAKVLADYKYEELICMEVDCEHIELQNEGKCIGDEACIKEYFNQKIEKGE